MVNLGIEINAKIKTKKLKTNIENHMQEKGLFPIDSAKAIKKLARNATHPKYVSNAFEDKDGNIIIIWKGESITIIFKDNNAPFKKVLESRKTIIQAFSILIKEVREEAIDYKDEKFTYNRVYSFSLTNPNTLSSLVLTPLSLFAIFLIWYFVDPEKMIGPLISFGVGLGFAIFLGFYQWKKFKDEIFSLLPW